MTAPTQAPWFMASVVEDFAPVAHTRLRDQDVYILCDPAAVVKVFIEQGRNTTKGADVKGRGTAPTPSSSGEGEAHMRHRRLAQPAFTADRLRDYGSEIVLRATAHAAVWRHGQQIDVQDSMAALCLANMARCLFGLDLHSGSRRLDETLEAFLGSLGHRLLLPEEATTVDRDNRTQRDMLSLLLAGRAPGFGYDEAGERDAAVRAVLSDPEPTAMNLTWTWFLLARHPEAAHWLREELDSVLGDRDPSVDDLLALRRTRAVLTESMRLYPPAWVQGRRLAEDVDVDGWLLPSGSLVMASQFAMHRSPRWWDSAEEFIPQRWIDADGAFGEDVPGQPRGAWFPFGTGSRRCIGERLALMEATLVLASLARTWSPVIEEGHAVAPRGDLTLRADGGIPMVLMRR
ncbi:MAG: hypothetical protein RL347_1139 [Actinomycetota bacterium]